MATASENYQAGRLKDAIDSALSEVKSAPSDTSRRGLLAELFCFAGEWERADKQIDTIGHQEPEAIISLSLIRQLVRASVSRQECYEQGRPPELLTDPSDDLRLRLEALIAFRENDLQEAARLLQEAEAARTPVRGVCDGEQFEDFRDLDDLTASVFEVLTSTGKYYWIPIERVTSIEFRPPQRPRDLLWRRAEMVVADGPDGEVYLPAIYYPGGREVDDQLRLGRATDWSSDDNAPSRGVGQRMFLVGENAKTIMQIEKIEFTRDES